MLTLKITVIIFSLMTRRTSLGNTLGFRAQHLFGADTNPGERTATGPTTAVQGDPSGPGATDDGWTTAQAQHTQLTHLAHSSSAFLSQ